MAYPWTTAGWNWNFQQKNVSSKFWIYILRTMVKKKTFGILLNHQCEAHAGSTPCFIVGILTQECKADKFLILTSWHHTFGRGAGYVQDMPGDQLENRQYLIDFCRYNCYIITSPYLSNRRKSSARSSFLRLSVLRRHGHRIHLPNMTTFCVQNAGKMQ